ncbi:MAG: MarR family transcriptional regulator [Caldilineae bacterium]|nr:MAG: MarR family transcriptional regulator [Caldilineae bacterium]
MMSQTSSVPDDRRNEHATADLHHKLLHFTWLQHRRLSHEISGVNLTLPQYYTLDVLVAAGGACSIGDLARWTQQVSATMTGIVDRLVRDGLAQRQRAEEDRRTVIVAITPEGRRRHAEASQHIRQAYEQMLHGLEPQEKTVACRAVDKVLATLKQAS